LVPLGPFGELLKGCAVEGFRSTAVVIGEPRDHAREFDGLAGKGIPLGEYDASVRCGDSVLHEHVVLDSADQLSLVVRTERILISDHVKPRLVIAVERIKNSAETWRIEFVGLYNRKRYTSGFEPNSGEASVTDPETGSYFVSVESSGGYSCGRQIDLMEFTRQWKFEPSACSFRLDQYAHLVERTEAKGIGGWYEQMRLQKDQLFQSIRGAAAKR